MRCENCDKPKATEQLFEDHDDGCECAECMSVCWSAYGVACESVDWRSRALRAEAEVRALCDDPEALNPWLPEGWAWDAAALRWRGPHDLYLTWDTRLGRNKRGAFCPRRQRDGLVAAMVDAVADVMAAEGL